MKKITYSMKKQIARQLEHERRLAAKEKRLEQFNQDTNRNSRPTNEAMLGSKGC
jgi:hypothetical protein